MKQKILTTVAALGILLALTAISANAQSGSRMEARVNFDFVAGDIKLTSGNYTITQLARNEVLFRNAETKTSAIVVAPIRIQQRQEGSPVRLVFKRYGNEYFLAQVWADTSADGAGIYPSKHEARLAKEMKQNNSAPQTVEVMAARAN